MTNQQINSRLLEVLTDMGISLASLDDDIDFSRHLGLDSLDIANLMLQVELYFCIRVRDEDWYKLQTLGQLKEYIADELTFTEIPIKYMTYFPTHDVYGYPL